MPPMWRWNHSGAVQLEEGESCQLFVYLSARRTNRPEGRPLHALRENSAEIAPVVKLVGVFYPAVADVRAVVHVWDQNVLNPRIDLSLRLPHRLAAAYHD